MRQHLAPALNALTLFALTSVSGAALFSNTKHKKITQEKRKFYDQDHKREAQLHNLSRHKKPRLRVP